MHELGIVFHVIKSVEEIAQENELTKVSAVTLSIGKCPASCRLISQTAGAGRRTAQRFYPAVS